MIEFPELPGGAVPRWVGPGFQVDGRAVAVLEYSYDETGWDDSLTAMHEEEAGAGDHPIDAESRRKALSSLRNGGFPPSGTLIEVGCSSGFLLRQIRDTYPAATLVGADVVSEPLARLSKQHPDIAFVRMDLVECALPSEAFDAVVALNVLEHIEQDDAAVRQAFRILRPGGIFVVEVPQGPALFDAYDRQLRHFRRYTSAGLYALLAQAGFDIEYRSHLGFLIYPAFAAAKLAGRGGGRGASADHARVTGQIRKSHDSRLLGWSLRLDAMFDRFARLPVGIRCVATARKRLG
jgi:SAM-dependent methyltransferase